MNKGQYGFPMVSPGLIRVTPAEWTQFKEITATTSSEVVPANVFQMGVMVFGGGGGPGSTNNYYNGGAGGGFAYGVVDVVPGQLLPTITISPTVASNGAAGGTCSFGSLLTATGGGHGNTAAPTAGVGGIGTISTGIRQSFIARGGRGGVATVIDGYAGGGASGSLYGPGGAGGDITVANAWGCGGAWGGCGGTTSTVSAVGPGGSGVGFPGGSTSGALGGGGGGTSGPGRDGAGTFTGQGGAGIGVPGGAAVVSSTAVSANDGSCPPYPLHPHFLHLKRILHGSGGSGGGGAFPGGNGCNGGGGGGTGTGYNGGDGGYGAGGGAKGKGGFGGGGGYQRSGGIGGGSGAGSLGGPGMVILFWTEGY